MVKSFKSFLYKEYLEGLRSYKFLIIAIGIILFAILDPIMLKLLPLILQSQIEKGLDLTQLIKLDQEMAFKNYLKDLFQIGNIFIALTLMGIISDEIKNKTIVFPLTKGVSLSVVIISKFLIYSIAIFLFTLIGFLLNYYQITNLFTEKPINFNVFLNTSIIFGIYYIFNISLIILVNTIIKTNIPTAILSLIIIYGMSLLSQLKQIKKYIPYYLNIRSNEIFTNWDKDIFICILLTIIISIIFIVVSIYIFKKQEIH